MKIRPLSRGAMQSFAMAVVVVILGLPFAFRREEQPRVAMSVMPVLESLVAHDNPGELPTQVALVDTVWLRNWADKDPLAASDYVAHYLDVSSDAKHPLGDIVRIFAKQDLEKAGDFVNELVGNKHYDVAMGGYLSVLATKKPNEAMSRVTLALIAESSDAHIANAVVVVNAAWESNQANIESWAATLPSSRAREDTADAIEYLKMNAPDLTLRAEK